MSFLSNELAATADKNGIKQIEITKRTGLTVGHVSRIFNGVQVFVTDSDLDKIISIIARSDPERTKIVRARLLDAYRGRYSKLVRISGAPKGEELILPASLDPDVKEAFEYLASLVPGNPHVGDSILQLARMMGLKR